MKYTNIIFIFLALIINAFTVTAGEQTFKLKDGSQFIGYASKQDMQENDDSKFIVISYTQCERVFRLDKTTMNQISKPLGEWPEVWQKWAVSNGAVSVENGKQILSLTEIGSSGEPVAFYHILESANDFIKALCLTPGSVTIKASDLKLICQDRREALLLNDLDDVVKTNKTTYRGIIVEQNVNKEEKFIKIWDKTENRIYVVSYRDIVYVGREGYNSAYTIWQQAAYFDRLIFTDHSSSSDGLIISRNISGSDIRFMTKEGREYTYTQNDQKKVERIEKYPNPDYTPIYDIFLKDNESRIQRDTVLNFVKVSIDSSDLNNLRYFAPVDSKHVYPIIRNKHIVIETGIQEAHDAIVVKANQALQRKDKKDKTGIPVVFCFESEIARSIIDAKREKSINNTVKFTFDVTDEAYYFVMLKKLNKYWIFKYEPLKSTSKAASEAAKPKRTKK